MLQEQLIADMKACQQTASQSVYEHGISVSYHISQLISFLEGKPITEDFRIPEWFNFYKKEILASLLPRETIEEYTTYHDCGKPYCLTIDDDGKRHFPDHANISYQTWLSAGGSEQAAKLMKMDMMIHTMKANDIDEFIKHPEAITLLLAGLAEIHSNAQMFGGIESTSFKIKWNQINKRGKAICQKLFTE